MYAITGAAGQLGRLTIQKLMKSVPAGEIIAAVRNPPLASDLAAWGVQVRLADYDRPDTLGGAFAGADKLLLISSNLATGRVQRHQAVLDAAKAAGVKLIAYTSLLHADRSGAKLAKEHLETESILRASGVPTTLLRNGWYTENYLMALQPTLASGKMYGAAGNGKISLAARADYAEAAAAALTTTDQPRTYELAGDTACTLSELAAEISRQAARKVAYSDMPKTDYEDALVSAGTPAGLAALLADAEANAAKGALFDDGHALSRLIGRPTTPIAQSVSAAL
jgi:NAD(P)H dehydrogenase (quinone)